MFFCSRIPSKISHYYVSVGFFGCDDFLDFSWFWWFDSFMIMKWPSLLRSTSWVYCRIFYWSFSWLDWGYGFLKGTSQFRYHLSDHIEGIDYQYDLLILMLTLIIWLKWHLSGFSTVKLPFVPLTILYPWEGSYYEQPPLRNEELCSPSFQVGYLYNLSGILLHGRLA